MGRDNWTTRAENGWEIGWRLGARASRPRRFRKAKTGRKPPVFRNLPSSGAAGSRISGSHAMLVQKVLRHFRGCGILPRPTKGRISGRKAAPHLVTFHVSLVTAPEGRHGILPRPSGWRAGGNGRRKTTSMSRMSPRGLGWLGDGRDVYIENQENRFADRNAWSARKGLDPARAWPLLPPAIGKVFLERRFF